MIKSTTVLQKFPDVPQADVPSGMSQICRLNKLLVNHFKIEDLTGNNKKKYAIGVEIANDFKL